MIRERWYKEEENMNKLIRKSCLNLYEIGVLSFDDVWELPRSNVIVA